MADYYACYTQAVDRQKVSVRHHKYSLRFVKIHITFSNLASSIDLAQHMCLNLMPKPYWILPTSYMRIHSAFRKHPHVRAAEGCGCVGHALMEPYLPTGTNRGEVRGDSGGFSRVDRECVCDRPQCLKHLASLAVWGSTILLPSRRARGRPSWITHPGRAPPAPRPRLFALARLPDRSALVGSPGGAPPGRQQRFSEVGLSAY